MRGRFTVLWPVVFTLSSIAGLGNDIHADRREAMVEQQIAARGIKHPGVLQAMADIERHLFVLDKYVDVAYGDLALPIDMGQTISQPYIVAHMTERLEPELHHKVLEIGTGSGYQAAVLAELVDHVYSIEIHEELALQAEARVRDLGYENITIRTGDGYKGWPHAAPFDRIIVTAAPPELPETLLVQLKPGGILVAPVGPRDGDQYLVIVTKDVHGSVRRKSTTPVRFVPMVPKDSRN